MIDVQISRLRAKMAADRERAQERLVRLRTDRGAPGSGLGLSLVRAVAGLHGASVALEDNQPGLRVVCEFPTAACLGQTASGSAAG